MHLRNQEGCTDGTLHIVFEERGKKEDDTLELEFRRVLDQNRTGARLPFDIVFSSKQSNAPGLQLADLVARPICRHLLKPDQPNRAYEVIKEKFRRIPEGETEGWGLKIFPERPKTSERLRMRPERDTDRLSGSVRPVGRSSGDLSDLSRSVTSLAYCRNGIYYLFHLEDVLSLVEEASKYARPK